MTKKEAKKFEKLLVAERDRLSEGIRKIEEETLYESTRDNTGDLTSYAEVGTDNFERETALNIATGESNWLRDVNDALRRIEAGSYGMCEGCNKEIPKKRLEVFPAAKFCVECQSKLEKSGRL
ncbi:MAG: TraR/DksA C4-type zinc finger protein [Candidatus Hydrogenedentes bacterium]|nr:TraR/DksA C4-type zinc finger protein [Candidatus Hydrogenedentota bacterium]